MVSCTIIFLSSVQIGSSNSADPDHSLIGSAQVTGPFICFNFRVIASNI